jgi:hypothetical protein
MDAKTLIYSERERYYQKWHTLLRTYGDAEMARKDAELENKSPDMISDLKVEEIKASKQAEEAYAIYNALRKMTVVLEE